MSGGVTGPGAGRINDGFEPADAAATDSLVNEFNQIQGSGPRWLSFLDADSSLRALAQKLMRDGKIDEADAKALVRDAKDYGKVTTNEKKVFANLLREHSDKFSPVARDALAKFFGLPIGRPQGPSEISGPAAVRVQQGTSEYSFDDDKLIMTGEGKFTSSIGREVYSAGYLPMKEGPMLKPLGTKASDKSMLSTEDNKINKDKSAVERFDVAMKRATGRNGGLAAEYAREGKRDEADSWWGFCDRWAYNSLDPEISAGVNKPLYYKGMYFSTAELRGLATYTGRSDESGGMFDKDVTPLDLQKATSMFLQKNGPGFISDVWLDKAHEGNSQVWNQPFHAVEQNQKELKGSEYDKVMREQFGVDPARARADGKKIYLAETNAHYGMEVGDDHEGAASHRVRNWKSYVLTDSEGVAKDGKWAPGSDEAPEYIWMPKRSGRHDTNAQFLRDMLKTGVSGETVTSFEADIARLGGRPASAQQKADLARKYKGVANAYSDADFAAKLRPLGLKPADFK